MAAPVKDGKKWRPRVMVDGVRSSGTFDTKAAALAWEATVRTAPRAAGATTQTCADAFDKYEREVSREKPGARWEKLRLAAFGRSSLGSVKIRDINASHIGGDGAERFAVGANAVMVVRFLHGVTTSAGTSKKPSAPLNGTNGSGRAPASRKP